MSYLLLKTRGAIELLPVKVYSEAKVMSSVVQEARWRILNELSEKETYARDISRKLGLSEQAVCHHLRRLEELGLIQLRRTERRRGAVARFYRSQVNSVALVSESARRRSMDVSPEINLLDRCGSMLDPFIAGGKPSITIVVGSPTEHGEFKASARDGHHAANLALFLGSLLPITRDLVVRLDTETDEPQLKNNLILVGGPRANTITARFNDHIPIRFSLTTGTIIVSTLTGKTYGGDEEGIIAIADNPISPDHRILVLAGNTHVGTASSIVGFVKRTEAIALGNSTNNAVVAKVVRGTDLDSDGLIDDVEFLE